MGLQVMKFGGSSLGDAERIQHVAKRIAAKVIEGHNLVVVVSAMGDTTDDLIDLAMTLNAKPPVREMDMLMATGEQVSMALLAMTLQKIGVRAQSFTGWQAGIQTTRQHGRARITNIDSRMILDAVEEGNVAIVAGFQGIDSGDEITTLGRGGSDTTAVALAANINAEVCEIYTDVEGVYTADPRIVPLARKLEAITYDEMLELASLGAAVLHPRAVEVAKYHKVKLVVRSSFSSSEGTIVKEEVEMEPTVSVAGITYDKSIARISLLGVNDTPGVLATVFSKLSESGVNVDIIVQSSGREGKTDFSFTTSLTEKDTALRVLEALRAELPYDELNSETGLAKISLVGAGMVSNPGVAATMFKAISDLGVNIKVVSTSEIKISCIIELEYLVDVVQTLHTAYQFDTQEPAFVGGPRNRR